MPHEHLCLDHFDRLQSDADHDDDGGAADGHVHDPGDVLGNNGQDGYDTQVNGAEEGQTGEDLGQELSRRTAGAEARNKAAVLFRLLATSTGLNWMVA